MLDQVTVNGGLTLPLGEDVGELFQLPKVNEDIKQDRYLFTAINMITSAIIRDCSHMKDGGLNIHNPCLRHAGDFVKRGRIVPLLTNTHTPIPVEEANTENSAYFEIPAGGDTTFRGDGPLATEGGYVGYPAYPGQQIGHILEGSVIGGIQRLLGELSTLKGHKYTLKDVGGFLSDPDLWKIQIAIFPTYPQVPVTLSEFTQQVQSAFDNNIGDIRNVAQDMLPVCQQCDAWAVRHIETVHQNMAQAATKGYAHPYDQVDLLILEQLGMKREDEHFKRTAQQAAATAQAAIDPASLVALLEKSGDSNREMFLEGMERLIEKWKSGSSKPVDAAVVSVDPLSVDKEEMMKIYARDVHRYGVAKAREAAAKGIYGDLHHKTREKIEREVSELLPEDGATVEG